MPWSASEHGRDTKKSWACTAAWQSPASTVHCATGSRLPPAERVESPQCNGFSTIKHSRTGPLCTSSSDRRTTKLFLHVSLVLSGSNQSFSLLARFPTCQMFDSRIVSINSLIVTSPFVMQSRTIEAITSNVRGLITVCRLTRSDSSTFL